MGAVRSRRLAGRTSELSALVEALARANDAHPTLVVVEGEPGIGKTRLVRELAVDIEARDPDAVIVTGHGVNLAGGAIAYGLVGSLLEDLALEIGEDSFERLIGPRARALDPLLHGVAEAARSPVDRLALFGAVQRLLTLLARDRLVAMFVEDLHWADASSLDLLLFLAKAVRSGRLLVVGTARPATDIGSETAGQVTELLRAADVPVVRVGPLSSEEVAEQVSDALDGAALPAALRQRVETLSDGVPLYVEELLAAVLRDGRRPDVTAPSALTALVASRTSQLGAGALATIQAAAVAERPFAAHVLATVRTRPEPVILDELAEGVEAGLLDDRGGDTYRFHHALLRQALADSLAPSVRRGWHRRWAEVLAAYDGAGPSRISEIASHRYLGGDVDAAFVDALAAAREAQRVDAAHEAAAHLRRALELWPRCGPQVRAGLHRDSVVVRLVVELEEVGDFGAIGDLVVEERRHDPPTATRALWLDLEESDARFARGAPDEFELPDLEPILVRSEAEAPTELLFRTLVLLATQFALSAAERARIVALAARTARALDLPGAEAAVATMRADAAAWGGDHQSALLLGREAMTIAAQRPREHRAATRTSLKAAWSLGQLDVVVDLGERALERIGAPPAAPTTWQSTATVVIEAHRLLGHYDRSEELIAAFDQLPESMVTGAVSSTGAVIAALRGREEAYQRLITRAERLIPAVGARGSSVNFTGLTPWARAVRAMERGGAAEAVTELSPLLDQPELAESPDFDWVFVLTAAQCLSSAGVASDDGGHRRRVRRAAAALEPIGRVGAAWSAEVAAHLAGSEGDHDPASWAVAAERWRDVEAPWHEASCLTTLADALLNATAGTARERRAAASEHIARARGLAHGVGAVPLVARIDELAGHARLGNARPISTSVLTDRESEVLRLLSRGQTNEQIGASLYMSPKTASVHVSRIIAKLGVANRTEAVGAAHRLGLLEAGDGLPVAGGGRLSDPHG